MNKQPQQTAKTRQSLIDAFWELAFSQGVRKVTVSAITKKAGVNRGTFYVYFVDIPELLTLIENDLIHDLQKRLISTPVNGGAADFNEISGTLIDIFSIYDDKFFLLIGENGDPNFRKRIQEEATKKFKEVFQPILHTEQGEYIVAYLTSALLGLLTYWHATGRKISVTELGSILYGLATTGVLGLTSTRMDALAKIQK